MLFYKYLELVESLHIESKEDNILSVCKTLNMLEYACSGISARKKKRRSGAPKC